MVAKNMINNEAVAPGEVCVSTYKTKLEIWMSAGKTIG